MKPERPNKAPGLFGTLRRGPLDILSHGRQSRQDHKGAIFRRGT
ncbi:hypothetical protein SAMN04488056_11023 [Cohaesibacter marisflavi]|uniref:Uncharacterized protein n=1 Tax=Cohaesibacter marisflavi TaxID=655353 RepID=A0A1I5IW88_9HYPH|nr:hypothetical protein SAMN04488056_11023 [Cohaesibacter marisflavi]